MSETVIRRRTLPDSLRYLARKLDEPLTDGERAGVALTLNSLADEIDPDSADPVRPLLDQLEARIRTEGGRWDSRRMLKACRAVDHHVTVHRARRIFQHLAEQHPDLLVKVDGTRWSYDATPSASKPDLLQALANALTALTMADEEPELEYDHIDCVSGTVWWGNPVWTAQQHPGRQQQSAGPVRPDEQPTA